MVLSPETLEFAGMLPPCSLVFSWGSGATVVFPTVVMVLIEVLPWCSEDIIVFPEVVRVLLGHMVLS